MRLILASLWILAGAALTAGAYWSFLITPESTIWSLLVSAILALVALALVGWTMNGAILVGWQGASIAAVQRAWRSIPAVIPAALLVALVWWMTGRAEMWVANRSSMS